MAKGRKYTGTSGNDYFRGTAFADFVYGRAGDDDLAGGAGDDFIDGGAGNDLIEGGAGADTLIGGEGIDALSYAGSTSEVHVDLAAGYAIEFVGAGQVRDTISGFEVVIGSARDDSIRGSAGDDDLRGGAGNDVLSGGAGDDVLRGDAGNDVMDGGDGFDYADYFYTDGANISLLSPTSTSVGGGTDDLRNIEGVIGSRKADIITGNNVANHLVGEAGNDQLFGNGGDDRLDGGTGDDVLSGGDGADRLNGGLGRDTLTGGTGADLFYFEQKDLGTKWSATDRITDFSQAEGDRIDLSAIDANLHACGDDGFSFIGRDAFSGIAGELRFAFRGNVTVIEGDVNGDRIADGVLVLEGRHDLTANDFLL